MTVGPNDNTLRAEVVQTLAHDLYVYSLKGPPMWGPPEFEENGALSEAINLYRQALRLLPLRQDEPRPSYLSRLALALRARFTHTGRKEDLDECVSLHHTALSFRPHSHTERPEFLLNLAAAIWARFELLGVAEDLEKAIRLDQEAVELRPPGHPDRLAAVMALGTDLVTRYLRTHQLADLRELFIGAR